MKPLNLIVGLNLGLLLTGCPGDDSTDDGANTTIGTDTTVGTTVEPITTTDDGADSTTTEEPGTTTEEPVTTTEEPGTTTEEPGDDTTAGTTDDTTGEPAVSFATDVYPIIMENCGCHVEGGPGGLQMPDAATAYGNLVDVPSNNGANDDDRIEPGDADASFLWQKVTEMLEPGEGDDMPPGKDNMLGADQLATIEAWIVGGAQP